MRKLLATLAIAGAAVAMIAAPAGANHLGPSTTVALTCSTASAEYQQFSAGDLPITFHVSVNGGTVHDLVSTGSLPGAGTAVVDISSLTGPLNGSSGSVSAYVTWTGHSTHEGLNTVTLTCGEAPTTTTTTMPATTTTTRPAPPATVGPPLAPVVQVPAPVKVPAKFTG